jgi:hypothetical protein
MSHIYKVRPAPVAVSCVHAFATRIDDLDVPIDADLAGLSFCISSSHTSHAEFVYYYLLRIDFAAPPQAQYEYQGKA